VNVIEQHAISESDHRILNPFSEEELMLLGDVCRLRPGIRQLDLASGKGEMLCRWADRYGISGLGVDISAGLVAEAMARADELGVGDRVRFEEADAGSYAAEAAAYDVVSCIGATWIGDGLTGTVERMKPALRAGGLLLVGEPFWHEQPPDATVRSMGFEPDEFTTLVGTLDRFESVGVELVEMVLADQRSWDRYSSSQWWNIREWLRDHPDHPEASSMLGVLEDTRRSYLEHRRRYLGWGVFVLRVE
jgi:methyltransferase family protein